MQRAKLTSPPTACCSTSAGSLAPCIEDAESRAADGVDGPRRIGCRLSSNVLGA
jgi:hypothetical protein